MSKKSRKTRLSIDTRTCDVIDLVEIMCFRQVIMVMGMGMVKAEKGKKVEWCDWQVKGKGYRVGVRLLLVALSGKVFNTRYYSPVRAWSR